MWVSVCGSDLLIYKYIYPHFESISTVLHTSHRPSDICLDPPEATNHVGYNELPVNIAKSFEKTESKRKGNYE